jgi:TolB protein
MTPARGSGARPAPRQLISAPTHIAPSTFSPDGKSIATSKGPEGRNIDVFVMRLDRTHMRRITHSKLWESAPNWGPC